MRKPLCLFVAGVLMIFCLPAAAQSVSVNGNGRCNLRVIVEGFQSDRGFAKIGLCNTKEAFELSEERATIHATVRIVNKKAEYIFRSVPAGRWAVSAYHDENSNGKLDKGMFDKPTELYGFSNNARGMFSRPDFEQAAVVLDQSEMAVRVTVR